MLRSNNRQKSSNKKFYRYLRLLFPFFGNSIFSKTYFLENSFPVETVSKVYFDQTTKRKDSFSGGNNSTAVFQMFCQFSRKEFTSENCSENGKRRYGKRKDLFVRLFHSFQTILFRFLKKKTSKPSNFSNQSNYTFQTRKSVRIYFLKFFYQKTTFVENVNDTDNYPNEKSIHTNFSFIKPEQR